MIIAVKIIETIILLTVCIFGYILAYQGIAKVSSDEVTDKVYKKMETTISKRKDIGKLQKKINAKGIPYYLGKKDISPTEYLCIRLVGALIIIGISILLNFDGLVSILMGVLGYIGIDFLMEQLNKRDNENMTNDIYQLFSNLRIQLDAGVYLINALMNCHYGIKNKRLRKAIDELITEMSSSNITSIEAIEHFENKFSNNGNIRNLAVLFKNYINYGVSESYLKDIMNEINDISASEALKAEHDLDNKTGILNVCFCCVLMAIVVFGMIQTVDVQTIFGA